MQGALALRVLEIGEQLSGAYAGLILAHQGASVCQWRIGLDRKLDAIESAYFDRGRIVPDGAVPLLELAAAADVLLCDLHPRRLPDLGLPANEEELQGLRPGLVMVAVSSLGLDGPHAGYAMEEITDWASGGLAYATRRAVPDDDDERYSPVLAPGRQPEILGGIAAATGAFAGLRLARETGNAVLVDVSRQQLQAAMLHNIVPPFVWNGTVVGAPSARQNIGMLLPASDGEIYLRTVEDHQFRALIAWMGSPAWAEEPWVADPLQRRLHGEAVRAVIGEWTSQHPRRWLYEDGQRNRVPVALPRTVEDVLETDQLEALGFWRSVRMGDADVRAPSVPLLDGGGLPEPELLTPEALRREWKL